MNNKKNSRFYLTAIVAALVLLALITAFWPQAIQVDFGKVKRQPLTLSITEEARTRVHDYFVVSAPVAGSLLRVAVEPGDLVQQNATSLFSIQSQAPELLDNRRVEIAGAQVKASQQAVDIARHQAEQAQADLNLASSNHTRTKSLYKKKLLDKAEMDQAAQTLNARLAALQSQQASIKQSEQELLMAQAALFNVNESSAEESQRLDIASPITGQVLKVFEESEKVVLAGQPIVALGDIKSDLEIVSELLSSDAVKVKKGAKVTIKNWGGEHELEGRVTSVEPGAFTKFSALGVEEQRVKVIIEILSGFAQRNSLGHDYRVEVEVDLWADNAALTVPSSALFRRDNQWHVFLVDENKAELSTVEIGHNNGLFAQLKSGLSENDTIILYPTPEIQSGTSVISR